MQNKFTGEEKVGGSRYKIFRCTEYLSEDLGVNLGFWIIFIIILFNIAIGYFFWRAPFTKIINFLRVFEREYNKPSYRYRGYSYYNNRRCRYKFNN